MSDEWSPEDGAGYIPTEEGGDGHSDEHADEWDDLSNRELLEGIFIITLENRALLQAATDAPQDDAGGTGGERMYECGKCGSVVADGDAARHAEKQHKAPPGMWESLFTEVEQ